MLLPREVNEGIELSEGFACMVKPVLMISPLLELTYGCGAVNIDILSMLEFLFVLFSL